MANFNINLGFPLSKTTKKQQKTNLSLVNMEHNHVLRFMIL